MDVQSAVRTGALFGISQNNIRVTLTRLVASNLLNKAQRGCYTLGAEGVAFAQQVNHWREAESLLCLWRGETTVEHVRNVSVAIAEVAFKRRRKGQLFSERQSLTLTCF